MIGGVRGPALAVAVGLLAACAGAPLRPEPGPERSAPTEEAGPTRPEPPEPAPGPTEDAQAPEDAPAPEDAAEPDEADEPETAQAMDLEEAELRERIVAAARARLGRRFRGDCSGFVLAVYRAAGIAARPAGFTRSRSEGLYRASREVETPRPGDLAFFHDTYDRNRNRKLDDRFTHVAIVEAVDGTEVTLLHRSVHGVERLRMDLSHPSDAEANGILRLHRRGDVPGTRYLAGELFAAFGALLDGEFTQMLQAGRAEDTSARHPAAR